MTDQIITDTDEPTVTNLLDAMETIADIAEGGFRKIESMARMVQLAADNPHYYHTPDIVADVMATLCHIAADCIATIEGECQEQGVTVSSPTLRRLDAMSKQKQIMKHWEGVEQGQQVAL